MAAGYHGLRQAGQLARKAEGAAFLLPALLRCCTAALLRNCAAALLRYYCATAALVHCCTAALLRYCTAALLRCCAGYSTAALLRWLLHWLLHHGAAAPALDEFSAV